MFSSVLLRKQSQRMFCTFSKVQSNAIMLSSMTPTRISIPVTESQSLNYAIDPRSTVQEFMDKVKHENDTISQLSIEGDETIHMQDLIQRRFELTINNKLYTVHPHLSTMVKLNNKSKVDRILGHKDIPVVRKSILSIFLDHLVSKLPNDPISKEQLKEIVKSAVGEYNPKKQDQVLQNIRDELKATEAELDKLGDKRKGLVKIAQNYASKMLLFGVSMAAGQVGGFAYLIYGVYTWDDMEPLTYLVGAFYAWVSMLFYFRFREDWEWSSAYEAFYQRRLRRLMQGNNLDDERISFLERYRDILNLQLAYLEK